MVLTVVSSGIEELYKSESFSISVRAVVLVVGAQGISMQVVLTFNSVLFADRKFHFTLDFFTEREGQ
jgi:hypothetical protein